MPDQKISADPDLAAPSAQARLAGIDPGTDTTKNYAFSSASLKNWFAYTAAEIAETAARVFFTPTERTKLSGVATGATANSPDATLLARANHTGTQAISTVTGLQTAIDSLNFGPVPQFLVSAGATLAVTRATHQGATIILGGSGATISFSATTQGAGFVLNIINDSGADWTVPAFAGATNRFDTAGNTKVVAGGGASLEVYTAGTLKVRVSGTTA